MQPWSNLHKIFPNLHFVSVLALSRPQTLLELHSRITAVSLLDPILTSKLDLDLCRGVAMLHTNCQSSSQKTLKAALQATEYIQQWQKGVGDYKRDDLFHSRDLSSSSSETSYHLREIPLTTKIPESDEGGDNFRGSMTLPLQKKPLTPTRYQGFYCFPACTVTLLYWFLACTVTLHVLFSLLVYIYYIHSSTVFY